VSFSTELGEGINSYREAHRVIVEHKLGKYLIWPGLISLAYVIIYFVIFIRIADGIDTNPDNYSWWLSWMGSVLEWFLKVVYWGFVVWLFFATHKFVIQTILSPMLSHLSEVVEKKLRGRETPSINWKEYVDDMIRAFRISIRNLLYEIILCFLASFIPIVGFIAVFVISAYYTGFGYMDYILERKRYTVNQSVAFVRKHKGLAVGLGIPMNFALLVPVVGWIFAPTYATVAATLEIMDLFEETEDQNPPQPQPFEAV